MVQQLCQLIVQLQPKSRIDATNLDAGDHNGATFHQHQRFLNLVRQNGAVEVSLDEGIWATRLGVAAQESARTGTAIELLPHSSD